MIELLGTARDESYVRFVEGTESSNYCHHPGWFEVIRRTYGKRPAYFIRRQARGAPVDGVLPSFFLSSTPFGKVLVSLPYLDFGGILAAHEEAARELLAAFLEEARSRGAVAELRCAEPLPFLELPSNDKVGMVVETGALDEETYWKRLDSKVRNQVRKAEKSGVSLRFGGKELLRDFYSVFARNMRDLGSPVHSAGLFANLLDEVSGADLGTAWREGRCIGGVVRIRWRDTLAIPWASTLREERIHCPNNLLYWESLRLAIRERCRRVDLGRSTRGVGTYRFKLQWMAQERPLGWYQFDRSGRLQQSVRHVSSGSLSRWTALWSRLPVGLTRLVGPWFRSRIPS